MDGTRWSREIMEIVRHDGGATITGLADRLRVSGETIRRHVRPLVAEGMLLRSHGRVRLAEAAVEPPFARRLRERPAAKRAIARAAAALVPDGATVMIDTGSTTAHVAAALAARRGLTVVTNSIEIARPLVGRGGHRVYIAGGEIRAELSAVVGPEALGFLGQFRADLAILSIGAIDPARGFMDFHLDEARVAQAMLAAADRAIVVADHTKFGARAPVAVCGFDAVDRLVTDAAPGAGLAAVLAEAGCALTVAPPR
jgi:DeoR family transcriptional regulator, glycerol-3-phosphate regulon repressor